METLATLTIIMLMAVFAPLIVDTINFPSLPVVVVEIALGIIIGPQVLGLARPNEIINFLSELGLTFLLFQAGFELRLDRILGSPIKVAFTGWIISIALALLLSALLQAAGLLDAYLYVGIAMSTTAIGIIIPILSDSGILQSSVGSLLLAIGAVGEFGPIVLSAILLEQNNSKTVSALLLNTFLLIIIAGFFLMRYWQPAFLVRIVDKTMSSTAQLGIRLSLLIMVGLIYLANIFGLSTLLGAFGAGLIVAQATSHLTLQDRESIDIKYQGLGFGFLIPIFFIVTGVKFDLLALVQSGWGLLLLPLFLTLFVVVRFVPILLLGGSQISYPDKLKIGLFSAVELPVVVAITNLGVKAGQLQPEIATAMVGAGMLSVFLLPLLALRIKPSFNKVPAPSTVQKSP